jgi:hypothetical protein
MVSVLCIDPGIFNLAYCLASSEDPKDFESYKIHLWNVCDIFETESTTCSGIIKKSGLICGKKSCFWYNGTDCKRYTCKTHKSKELKSFSYKKKCAKDYLLNYRLKRLNGFFDLFSCVLSATGGSP